MYIRTTEEALQAVADILDLPERRDQIIESTVRIMLCLEVEPRLFLADCQSLLIEGGLDALRRKRRDLMETLEDLPIAIEDPAEDRFFEEVASAFDALRLTDVVRRVFPALRNDRWQIARALLAHEAEIQEHLAAGIRSRHDAPAFTRAQQGLEARVASLKPEWLDRAGAIRAACLDALKTASDLEADRIHQEADLLFELVAVSDDRAGRLLAHVDAGSPDAAADIAHLRELADAVRTVQDQQGPPGLGGAREVA